MLADPFPLAVEALERVLCSSDSKSLAGGNLVLLVAEALDAELFAASFELRELAGGNRSSVGAFETRLFRSGLEPTSLTVVVIPDPGIG